MLNSRQGVEFIYKYFLECIKISHICYNKKIYLFIYIHK